MDKFSLNTRKGKLTECDGGKGVVDDDERVLLVGRWSGKDD